MIIHNSIFPLGRNYLAINLCGVVFTKTQLTKRALRHERIHTEQQREMLFVGFFLWYAVEWIVRLVIYRDSYRAYRNISFEREAYLYQHVKGYTRQRRHYAWGKFLMHNSKCKMLKA